jgi:hypothetical protein
MITSSGTLKIVNVWVRNMSTFSLSRFNPAIKTAAKGNATSPGLGAPGLAPLSSASRLRHYFDAGWLRPHT